MNKLLNHLSILPWQWLGGISTGWRKFQAKLSSENVLDHSVHPLDDEEFLEHHDTNIKLALWKKLFSYLKPYRYTVAFFCFLAVCTAVVDVSFPLVTKMVIDEVAMHGTDADFRPYALMYLGLVCALSTCVGLFIWMAGRIRTHVSHDIRRDGFENLQHLSFSFYDQRSVGWLMARMTSDCERLSNIFAWGVLDLVWGTTLMIGIATAMMIMNWKLALLVLSVIPVLMWISVIFQQHILKSARNVRKSNSRLTAAYNESIMGVRTSKAFVREEKNLEDFQVLSNNMYRFSVLNAIQSSLYLPIVLTLASLATGMALAFGGVQLLGGIITAGTLIAFMSYTRHFFEPIEQIAAWFAEMQMAQASAERIIGLIESDPAIQDLPTVLENVRQAQQRKRGPGEAIDGYPAKIETIECRNMSFGYLPGQPVLKGINLTIKAGENIAIVGSTGGGKSTLASLICRFYEPTQGQVLIDGVDYRNRSLHWLQSQLGVVLQSSHIFSGTVRENVRYGKLQATDDKIVEACKLAGAHSFIESLENGYDTNVGEGGGLLSAGQKQLISFARAILADPQILIMDEATSSIDTETEQLIQQGMQHLLEGRISLVIAHRLSTIRNADRILVMEQGCIAEQGSHDELIALEGRYFKLYQNQAVRESAYVDEAWKAA